MLIVRFTIGKGEERVQSGSMKFFVDAHLPFRLVGFLRAKGYDAKHTNELPHTDRTKDAEIRSVAAAEDRIVITKDSDFLDSHLLSRQPRRLLLISTGNITNNMLINLFDVNLENIVKQFEHHDLLELTNTEVIVHEQFFG